MRTKMRTEATILFYLTASLLINSGCKHSASDKLREAAENDLKANMNDPSSYEFVSMKPWDSTKISENISRERENIKHEIEMAKSDIDYQKTMRSLSGPYDKRSVSKAMEEIVVNKRKLVKLADIEKRLGDSLGMAASHSFKLVFRAKNTFGAKILNEYTLQTGPKPDYKLLNIAATDGQMFVMPGGFPGYDELRKQK